MTVKEDVARSLDRSFSRVLSWLWRSVTLRTETQRMNRSADGFRPRPGGVLLTQLGVGPVLLGQLTHVTLQLRLGGQEVLLQLLEEEQRRDGLLPWSSGVGEDTHG